MVAALLWWELRARLTRDEVAKHRLLPLELARLVIGVDPVGDIVSGLDNHQNEVNWVVRGKLPTAIFRGDPAEKHGW